MKRLGTVCGIMWIWNDYTWQTLERRHNERYGVFNNRCLDGLLNRLFRRISKKHQSSASLAFVRGIYRWPVNSPQNGPVTRKMLPFDDVFMCVEPWYVLFLLHNWLTEYFRLILLVMTYVCNCNNHSVLQYDNRTMVELRLICCIGISF